MTIKSALHALEQAKKLSEQSSQLLAASYNLVNALNPESTTTFSEGMEISAQYKAAYHSVSELQRKQFCLEDILDPEDGEFEGLNEEALRKAKEAMANG